MTPKAKEWRFAQLTLFVCAWMLVAPLLQGRWLVGLLLHALILNALLVTLWANPEWRQLRNVTIAVWLLCLVSTLYAALAPEEPHRHAARLVEYGATVPLFVLLATGILRFAFRSRRLTVDGVFATVAAYLLLALLFSQAYTLVFELDPGSFNVAAAGDGRPMADVQADLRYFSFVTLATLGYGDVLPLSNTTRTLAVIEAVVGQFYVAVIVAVFIGMFITRRES